MEGLTQSIKSFTKKLYPKRGKKSVKRRSHSHSKSHSKSNSASHSRSKSHSRMSSPNTDKDKRELSRKIIKSYKKLNFDTLAKEVDELHGKSKSVFTRKNKRNYSKSPSSPIILTMKNLDTGKQTEATVKKNANTGKYEFYEL